MARAQFTAGNEADYTFGTSSHGWDAFSVVDFHGVEAISQPFRYDVTLLRLAAQGPVPLESLLDHDASLAVAAVDRVGSYLRHGIVEEAEEIERSSTNLLYRVALVPHLARARHRRRCRTFFHRTLRQIVTDVLKNASSQNPAEAGGLTEQASDPGRAELSSRPFGAVAPGAAFRWDVRDDATRDRIDSEELRQYVVEYNESDLDFVARLLEEEGISYFFEHDAGGSVMWLTDQPGRSSIFEDQREPRQVRLHGQVDGLDAEGEQVVRTFREARRMRSRAVTMRDWHWRRSHLVLEGRAAESSDDDRSGHFEFPARDEVVQRHPCTHPSQVRLERHETERNLCEGTATLRAMQAGRRIQMTDYAGSPAQGHLVVRVETVATQLHLPGTVLDDEPFGFDGRSARGGPTYLSRFQALRADVRFRPEMRTPRPRIDGVQTAVVTDKDGDGKPPPEIHADEWARVRVRFPWDQRSDGQPSSVWIRVSQYWAGAGFGALYIPRVGQEVLVAYLQGDPDRPTIVGRVYNRTNPLPLDDVENRPERSTIKSHSTPDADGSNEIRFDDRAHHEEIYLHAQRNLTEVVRANHSTSVGGDQSNTVGGDQSTTVGGKQTITVNGEHQFTVVEHEQWNHVKGNRKHTVELDELDTVNGHLTVNTGGYFKSYAAANHEFYSTNFYVSTGPGPAHDGTGGDMQYKSATAAFHQVQKWELHVGSSSIVVEPGLIRLDTGLGASISLAGATITLSASGDLTALGGMIKLNP
jgi:type VI secretion system secreted protein VgrG